MASLGISSGILNLGGTFPSPCWPLRQTDICCHLELKCVMSERELKLINIFIDVLEIVRKFVHNFNRYVASCPFYFRQQWSERKRDGKQEPVHQTVSVVHFGNVQ